jgi:hypothetical protein
MNPLDERLRKEAKNYNDAKPAPRDSIELAYYDGAKLYAERCEQLEAEVRDLVEAQKSLMTIAAKVEAERNAWKELAKGASLHVRYFYDHPEWGDQLRDAKLWLKEYREMREKLK